MIVHTTTLQWKNWVSFKSDHQRAYAEILAKKFWPGPLTLVLPKAKIISKQITAGRSSVAIRVPAQKTAQSLLEAIKFPLCAPSANRFGRLSPTSAQDVQKELGDQIGWILDDGPTQLGLESTIISLLESPTLLRPGAIPISDIENTLNTSVLIHSQQENGSAEKNKLGFIAPGMTSSHYSPRKPLYLFDQLTERRIPKGKIGYLQFKRGKTKLSRPLHRQATLSRDGNLSEAAQNLYRMLRELDESDAEILVAEPPPSSEGLGLAIRDRLHRASRSCPTTQ